MSTDGIQGNIQRLHEQYIIVKAKRRRLYALEQSATSHSSSSSMINIQSTEPISNDVHMKPRILPVRKCKTAALHKMQELDIPYPMGAYRKKSIKDIGKVLVAIAPSSIPHAGLGLFLLSGPAEDGLPPPGTRVAT